MRYCKIILAVLLSATAAHAQSTHSPNETEASSTRKTRKELLRDPSSLGIGLSFDRYRDYVPPKDLQRQRRALVELGLGHTQWNRVNFTVGGLSSYPYRYRYGDPLGYQPFSRSPIYDWKAPEVRQIGNRWDIRPGYFRQSNAGGLWRP